MIRRAVAADIATIRERLAELPNPPYYPHDADIQELLDNPNVVAVLNDVTGSFALGSYSPLEEISTVIYLLPEAMGRGMTAPLALALLEGLYLIPAAQQRNLTGVFNNGFDDEGKEDLGKGKAEAWRQWTTDNGRLGDGLATEPVRDDSGAIIGHRIIWGLHDILMRFRELVRG